MSLVAYGFGVNASLTGALIADVLVVQLQAEPEVVLEDDNINVSLDTPEITITLEPELEVEVD